MRVDGRAMREVMVGVDKLEAVSQLCYRGFMLSAGSGCELAVFHALQSLW